MSRRHIFTERQRAALFDLPTDELSLLKFYTLGDDDLENIRQRRRPENRIGFALQLCALRYPGRALAPGEMIPREVLSFVGAQLGVVRRNPRNFRQPSSSPATSASRSMNLPSVWKV
ncbi:hypothetical protein WP9W18E04_P10310 (plasmid) [Aeromonas veronii]|nr:DUF4158 domain-containing protein [Aeromonas veronii]BBU06944.1 hypothetical protein WP9W18E04_P10310 [Aeromonas veronii]